MLATQCKSTKHDTALGISGIRFAKPYAYELAYVHCWVCTDDATTAEMRVQLAQAHSMHVQQELRFSCTGTLGF